MENLLIRKGLIESLLYLYPKTFKGIYEILVCLEGIECELQMHSIAVMSNNAKTIVKNGLRTKSIYLHGELSFNYQIIMQEIIDDLLASYNCFLHGFTKQTQQILRNIIELTIQMYYLKYVENENTDNWKESKRGIEKISDKIDLLKQSRLDKKLFVRIDKTYSCLCMATHSHKNRMTALTMPRIVNAMDKPLFSSFEILYTKGIFFTSADIVFDMMKKYLEDELETMFLSEIKKKLDNTLIKINEYRKTIDNFENGYIIHREFAPIGKNSQIMYSLKTDGTIECPGKKKKITRAENKKFTDFIKKRLVVDKF